MEVSLKQKGTKETEVLRVYSMLLKVYIGLFVKVLITGKKTTTKKKNIGICIKP